MKGFWLALLVFWLVLASAAHGAVIHGSVYDLDLNAINQAVVEIDTAPKQVMVSRNGTYSFTILPGAYAISARHAKLDLTAREPITVKSEGVYVLDLILFPDLETDEELLNETAETTDVPEYEEHEAPIPMWSVILLVFAVLAGIAWLYWKKRKQPAKDRKKACAKADLEEILAFVRKEGGRATQKDLRKAIPYSEAKVSLMIAELESQGRLKKIKKGRGNIVVLP